MRAVLSACYQLEEDVILDGMGEDVERRERELREVYTRFLLERMAATGKAAEFARRTGISPPELSAIKAGERQATEGQILKICGSVGPAISEALGRMALIARDVEKEALAHELAANADAEIESPLPGKRLRAQISAAALGRAGGRREDGPGDRTEQPRPLSPRPEQNSKR